MNRRDPFKKMNRYALYYGTGRAKQLATYDFAIVEPKGQSKEDVEYIQQSGTLVIAYVSVDEILPDSSTYTLLKDEDFLWEDGQKVINNDFGSYLLHLSSPRWRGLLHHQIGRYLMQFGFDGIFLDTIGDVERNDLSPSTQTEQLCAAVEFVAQLREYFPDHILIQNNGLEMLCDRTVPYLDAIMWENPPFLSAASQDWMDHITNKLKGYQKDHDLKVLILLENHGEEEKANDYAVSYSTEHSFPLYLAPPNYTRIGNEDVDMIDEPPPVESAPAMFQEQNEEDLEQEKEKEAEHLEDEPSANSTFDEYFPSLMQQLNWMRQHSESSLFEKTLKDYLLSSLPDQYHYAVATMLIEMYEKNREKDKLKQLLTELINRYQHPLLHNLLQSYLSQLT